MIQFFPLFVFFAVFSKPNSLDESELARKIVYNWEEGIVTSNLML